MNLYAVKAIKELATNYTTLSNSVASQSSTLSQIQSLVNSLSANSGTVAPVTNTTIVNNYTTIVQTGSVDTGAITPVVNNYYTSTGYSLQMSGTGQTATDALTAVQTETPRSALSYITDMFAHAFEVVRDFVALQITAVRGYFDEIWAKSIVSEKVTTDQICLKKSDGTMICINGDQLQGMMNPSSAAPVTSSTLPLAPTTPTSTGSTDSGSGTPSNPPTVPSSDTSVPGCMDSTATNYSSTATEDDGSCTAPVVVPDPITSPDSTTGTGA